jgi:integrase
VVLLRNLELQLKKAKQRLPPSWIEKANEFDQYLKVERDAKERARLAYFYALSNLTKVTKKELLEINKEDFIRWKSRAMDELSNVTQRIYVACLKRFFQWLCHYEEGEYPPIVRWMKVKKEDKIHHFEIVLEDVKKLADGCRNQRDRCLIMLAYDTGCRPEELLQIRIGDLKKDGKGYRIWLQGGFGLKTGERTLRIYPSIPDLELWLSMHPEKNNVNAYLFPSNRAERISYNQYRKLVANLCKKVGLNKHISPHSFRHLRATELCNSLSDAQMKARFGWTMDSRQLATYIHQSGVDVDECFLRHHGIEIKQEKPKTLEPKICPRGHKNSPSALFCSQCGMPLEKEAAIKMEKAEKTIDEKLSSLLESLLKDERAKEILKEKMKELVI